MTQQVNLPISVRFFNFLGKKRYFVCNLDASVLVEFTLVRLYIVAYLRGIRATSA